MTTFSTAMRYSVRTRSTEQTRMGGVHHDGRRGTDFLGWLYARRLARRNGGVMWTRHATLPMRKSRGCVTV
jgi:hypothetical protein